MRRTTATAAITLSLVAGAFGTQRLLARPIEAASHAGARKLMDDGNYQEALVMFRELTLADAKGESKEIAEAARRAISCMQQLNQTDQIDGYREEIVEKHAADWVVLSAIGQSYLDVDHQGFLIAGQFRRGQHRGGGEAVHASARDRIEGLRLFLRAVEIVDGDAEAQKTPDAASLCDQFASALLSGRGYQQAWQLQVLSNLDELPDYQEGWWYNYSAPQGAPVDEAGVPIYYDQPANWQDAENDGQRWRWLLGLRTYWQSDLRLRELRERAAFLDSQFGVQTMADYGWWFARRSDESAVDAAKSTLDLYTLGEEETIAKLATGIKRFNLPDEHNPIRLYQRLMTEAKDNGDQWRGAAESLAGIFENRRQYPQAAALWKQLIGSGGVGLAGYVQRLAQITGNWGRFEPTLMQPAGRGATLEYRYRNGKRVEFTAHSLKVAELLSDVKKYLASSPKQLDWEQMNIDNLGYRLIVGNQEKYVGAEVARWSLDLDPRAGHFDRRLSVTTPLQKAGAYLVTARMADGNIHRVVVWIADTAIVKKPLENKALYYIADAVTGKPVSKANVEFFGFFAEPRDEARNAFRINTKNFAERSSEQGFVELPATEALRKYQWLAIATTPEGRLAYLGFTGVWSGQYLEQDYKQVKVFTITDRPVYRPDQEVHYKFWVANAQFDQPDDSPFAGKSFVIEIHNPLGEKIHSESLVADGYGGLDGKWKLPVGATLGEYRITVANHGGGSFRVEEYKKPEYEVNVEAPEKPVQLGDMITAKITAKYYFGEPVTEARVKYKVLRTPHADRWFPAARWDWLYGPGYWWFTEDYAWYPGWSRWGCERPHSWWFWRQPTPPEVVAEAETAIGPDGTVEVEIDTAAAKEFHPDEDHSYEIQAEVVDQSRRTIVATGRVLAAREPFQVCVWANRGYYHAGDTMQIHMAARTLDGKPVKGDGLLRLLRIAYEGGKPVENEVAKWNVATDDAGQAAMQIKADAPGQYRISYQVTIKQAGGGNPPKDQPTPDTKAETVTVEGAQLLVIRGDAFDGADFRFNNLEIIADKPEYAPGDKVALQISANRADAAVLLFLRPANGVYLPPRFIQLKGKSTIVEFPVESRDMPNFFVEAVTVHGGRLHSAVREIFVPPAKRVIDVEVLPSAEAYLPGQRAKVKLKLTDPDGKPVIGSTAIAIYDKALDYIAGGDKFADIREFFWKWRRNHQPQSETNLGRTEYPVAKRNETEMQNIGVFGESGADQDEAKAGAAPQKMARAFGGTRTMAPAAPMAAMAKGAALDAAASISGEHRSSGAGDAQRAGGLAPPVLRENFADTALWVGALETNSDGLAEVELDMPENLTAWKINVWGMAHGTRVGQGAAEVVTRKNIVVRLQAPRFFVESDEVLLSANVHNYLDQPKQVRVKLELQGDSLSLAPLSPEYRGEGLGVRGEPAEDPASLPNLEQLIEIPPGGEQRVDWRVKATREGQATVRMLALTDEESDAMQMKFPVLVHGMLKTDSFTGVIRPDDETGKFTFTIPAERRAEQTRLEVRYSPTLAGAMLDALPYLIEYPYGCTEQTLNRFLPAVLTQRTLQQMGVDLKTIQEKRTNLNSQEIEPQRRAGGRKPPVSSHQNPVFDNAQLTEIVKAGVNRLTEMQLSDGGWGWFSGWGEHSSAHTTATVVRGLLVAKQNDVAVVPEVLDRGVAWLRAYQQDQLAALDNWDREVNKRRKEDKPAKPHADNLDALVYLTLTEAVKTPGVSRDAAAEDVSDITKSHHRTRDYLYQDRTKLAPYSLATFGLALHYDLEASGGHKPPENDSNAQTADMLAMVMRNISQYVKQDDENQTAWLDLPTGYWWHWYGSEYEAHAYYLKLLAAHEPKSEVASRLVKYLLNNRKHATYWNSTRDTALVVEAFADYLKATGETKPNLSLEVWLDGQQKKSVEITADTLFAFDNELVLEGEALAPGEHTVELRKKGKGPIYWSGYLANFTLEDDIKAAGLELKVDRRFYKLTPTEETTAVAGSRGQAIDQKGEKYDRTPIGSLEELISGDLVEVELLVDSKNDYEYIILDDMKAAGFEPVEVRSGYNGNELGAYVEYRDQRVTLFCARLARGQHSVSYRLRAEIPGKFSALPAKAAAMYAPELKANSDEFKVQISD